MTFGDVRAVIRREYIQRVRSKWFVFGTIAGPLLMIGLFVVPVVMAERGEDDEESLVVMDATGVLWERLESRLEDAGLDAVGEPWSEGRLEELLARVEAEEIGGVVVLDDATLASGDATLYTTSSPSPVRRLMLGTAVSRAALAHALEGSGVDAEAMLGGGELHVQDVSDEGASTDDPRFVTAYFGAFFLYMVILVYAVSVMRSTLEEKTSRIVEVVISAMKPWHLMLGKILGVGAVGLTQLAVWLGTGALLALAGVPALIAARPELSDIGSISDVLPGAGLLALFVGFFVLGYFMFSGLYAAVGAMCSTDEEAQQAQMPLVLLLVVPIVMVMPVIQDPGSAMATSLSLFPLFSPILMWARVAAGGAPAWQIGLSFVLMALAVLGIAWLAGRIYKVAILMTGKRPTLPELWRWVREG